MGSSIEINDTLKLGRGKGFPANVEIGKRYTFHISGLRLYHLKPVRVFLVEEVGDKWNYVGHALVCRQTIDAEKNETSGEFEVAQIYAPEYVQLVNRHEPPPGRGLLQ